LAPYKPFLYENILYCFKQAHRVTCNLPAALKPYYSPSISPAQQFAPRQKSLLPHRVEGGEEAGRLEELGPDVAFDTLTGITEGSGRILLK